MDTTEASLPGSPAHGSGERVLGNLPTSSNAFLGREAVLQELAESLKGSRRVTLTGPPGIGKSRLGLELARSVGADHSDGAFLVRLAAVGDEGLVPGAVASALSIQKEPGKSLTDTLVARLKQRHLLVVVDNCEHLLGSCARLAETLLDSCAGVTVLATSREPLGIAGETVCQVPPLSAPDHAEVAQDDELMDYEAVRLFVERARAVEPGFALNAYVAPAVVEICRRLDGIPLAIELAAARLESFTPAEIARHLDDRFDLTGGSLSMVMPHRTLEAALDWSHELLSVGERVLLRRLSVFVESFDAMAAAEICLDKKNEPDAPRGPRDTLELLARLASKSLIVVNTSPAGGSRYQLLETIRAYAAERLDEAGEVPALRHAHARYFLELAERAEPELTGPAQAAWLERLEHEHANLRSALEWSLSHGEAQWGIRLAGALVLFWRVRCHFGEGRKLLEAALSAGAQAPAALRAKALWGAGLMALMSGDIEAAVPKLEESVALSEEAGEPQVRARALLSLGDCAQYRRDPGALPLLEQSAELARGAHDSWCLAHALGLAAFVHDARGELARARALFEECLTVAREARDLQSLRYGLIGLGFVCISQGDYRSAEPLLDEGVKVTTELGEDYGRATALEYLGQLALSRCEYARARELLEEALALMPELGPPETHFGPLLYLAQAACGERDHGRARALLDEALALVPPGVDTPPPALRGMAELAAAEGDMAEARRLLERTLAFARASREGGRATAGALHALGKLARAEGDTERAVRLHHEALELRSQSGDVRAVVASLEAVAGLAPSADGCERSARLLGAAQAQRDENGYVRSPAELSREETDMAHLREHLGADGLAVAIREGAALSIEEAVAEAYTHLGQRGPLSTGWGSLTRRERQVAGLVAEGLTNPEIAERLHIARETVKRHLSRIFSKLGLARRGELAKEVWRRNGDAG